MKDKAFVWKTVLVCLIIVIYVGILVFISSVQSNYRVSIKTEQDAYVFVAGKNIYEIPVIVHNRANRLISTDMRDMYLSYHIFDENGNVLVYDNMRTPFGKTLYSGDKAHMSLQVSDMDPGKYVLEIDIVQEGVEWFSEQEDMTKKVTVLVQ